MLRILVPQYAIAGSVLGRKTCSKLLAALLLGPEGGLVGLRVLDLAEWCVDGEMSLSVVCMRLSARWDAI